MSSYKTTNNIMSISATPAAPQVQSARPSKESARPLLGYKSILTPDEAAHFILKRTKSTGANILSAK
ncbi:hypothetical protein BGZ81_010833 [Podila clonocystis]|nr:hypothetical protein BGZ81_010833 [Podila clonocystis]